MLIKICKIQNLSTGLRNADDDDFVTGSQGVSTSSVSPTKRPELALLFEVAKAIEMETEDLMAVAGEGRGSMEKQSMDDASRDDNSSNSSLMNRLRRPVMRRLRYEGYNAAVCKSRWSHRDGVPAGRNQDPWNHHHLRLSFIIIIICLPSSSSLSVFHHHHHYLSSIIIIIICLSSSSSSSVFHHHHHHHLSFIIIIIICLPSSSSSS